jgi:hypothetical protein
MPLRTSAVSELSVVVINTHSFYDLGSKGIT